MEKFKEHDIEWTDEVTSRLWDYYSKTYPYNQIYFTKSVGKDILLKTEKIIGSIDNRAVLDFGCGPAFFIEHLVDLKIKPAKYIGLDFSKDSVKNINHKENPEFELQGIFAQELPSELQDKSVDICFLIEVIEHLNDKYIDDTLNEIYRVLRPGGVLIITTPNNEDLEYSKNFCPECGCIYHKWQHERKFNCAELEKTILRYGFHTKRVSEVTFKSEGAGFVQKLKYLTKGFAGKNKFSLFGVFVK